MKVSVVVPTYHRHADLRRLLASLGRQRRLADEILVVVGPGDEVSFDIVAEFVAKGLAGLRSVACPQKSVVQALNQGLAEAAGDIICLTDDDAEPRENWTEEICLAFASDARVGAAGGPDRIQLANHPELTDAPPAKVIGTYTWFGQLTGNHHLGAEVDSLDVDALKGVNLSVRREALEHPAIDPTLISHGAEVGWEIDLCLKVKKRGYRIVYRNAICVLHYVSERSAGDSRNDFNFAAKRRVWNGAFLSAKYLSKQQLFLWILHSIGRGSRHHPGILIAIFLTPTQGLAVWQKWRLNTKSILYGVLGWPLKLK